MGMLEEAVRAFTDHPGVRAKRELALVREVLGGDGRAGTAGDERLAAPGDDTAALPSSGAHVLAGGEALWPPFVEADPYGAGIGAVVANVNDVAAMGGWCRGLVNTVVGPEATARAVLEGLRFAAGLYDVPVIGGHLTVRDGPPALSAFAVGGADALLSVRDAAPGQELLLAASLEGELHERFPFFSSVRHRGERAAGDVAVLPRLAGAGHCVAAKDVSMAGLLGSLGMLLEATPAGVAVELERVPTPAGVRLVDWLRAFPSFAFLLCAPPERTAACREAFAARGLACERIGTLDNSRRLRVRLEGEEATVADLAREGVTGLAHGRGAVTPT